ncbi:N-6 DNA methylase [Streptomyces sp. NPDC002176]|uniref:N-6 DNA methylase n=1 Tax=Streptomyces sp. NPDC002176 TaxID=3364634 RepID=UPI00384B4331
MDWLDHRPVPPSRLLAGETVGTTYGDRARKREWSDGRSSDAVKSRPGTTTSYRIPTGAVDEPRPENQQIVTDLMGNLVDRVRGAASVLDYLNLLFCLHYLRSASPKGFDAVADRARTLGSVDEANQLLRDIGRTADEDMRGIGVHSSMQEALGRLEPRTARDLRRVVEAMGSLTEDVFGLILDEYEQRAALGSGEFFTPRPVVRLMTNLACSEFGPGEPESVYDPYARDGGFLIEAMAACALDKNGLPRRERLQSYGETRRAETWRLATMNLLLHGVSPNLDLKRTPPWHGGSEGPPLDSFDIVLTNPPFNMSDPGGEERSEGLWAFGPPPLDNDNLAWVQHCVAKLGKRGRAAIIMPNKAGNSGHKAEQAIRRNLVESGVVDCVIALPAQLFTGATVPVCVWILRHPDNPSSDTLFLDARHMGTKSGSRRVLSAHDAEVLLAAYRAHRNTGGPLTRPDIQEGEHVVATALVPREQLCLSGYSLNPLDHIEHAGGGDGTEHKLISAWKHLDDAEEHLGDVQDALTGLPLGGRGPAPILQGRRKAGTFSLASLCEIQAGPSYTKLGKDQRSVNGTVPVVFPRHLKHQRVSDDADERVTEETARRLKHFAVRHRDIVCIRSGAIVPPALVQQHQAGWLMSPNIIRLRVPADRMNQVLPEYLLHYLCLDESVAWMRDRAAATAAPSLRSESLGTLRISLPPLAEQEERVAALNGLDELDRAHLAVADSARRARIALAEALLSPAVRADAATTPPHRFEKEAAL